jgi:coenzyme Q-binding protein COQ10
MPRLGVTRVLAYRPEQLFDIAADVERYPEFLPWWLSARILRRDGNVYYTDQVVGFGPVRQRFSTKTVLNRPQGITVTAIDGPFDTFQLTWRFTLVQHERCEATLDGRIELRVPVLGVLFDRAIGDAAGSILSAFEDRARRLYGPP